MQNHSVNETNTNKHRGMTNRFLGWAYFDRLSTTSSGAGRGASRTQWIMTNTPQLKKRDQTSKDVLLLMPDALKDSHDLLAVRYCSPHYSCVTLHH